MPSKLVGLKIKEVSLVPKGANKKPFFLMKSDDAEADFVKDLKESATSLASMLASGDSTLESSYKSKLNRIADSIEAGDEEAMWEAMSFLSTMSSLRYYLDYVMKSDDSEARRKISASWLKDSPLYQRLINDSADVAKDLKTNSSGGNTVSDKNQELVQITKEEHENMLKTIREMNDAQAKLTEMVKTSQEEARAEREKRIEEEYNDRASKYPHVNLTQEQIVTMLKVFDSQKIDGDEYFAKLEKAASESELLKEKGVAGDPAPKNTDENPSAQFIAKVDERQAAILKATPTMKASEVYRKAMDQVAAENPDLYVQHRNALIGR